MNDTPRNTTGWASPVATLTVSETPDGARNLVEGKQLLGAIQGFGKLWQKTYLVGLGDLAVEPAAVVREWREHFPAFSPPGNRFYAPLNGLEPGEVALIKAAGPAGMKLSTGIMVLYVDDESFTFMTPQGHMFAGWITFSASSQPGGVAAQAQLLMRAQDPLTELGLALGGHRMEDRYWERHLQGLARHLGAPGGSVERTVVCVDRRRQWSRAGNIRHSVALHSLLPRRSR